MDFNSNNLSGKDNIQKLQEILLERSKLQALVSQEENQKSQLQFKLIDLDKILKELTISITQKKYIVNEYDQLIIKTESTLKKVSDDLENLYNLIKTALKVELEPPKIYKIDHMQVHKPKVKQNQDSNYPFTRDYESVKPFEPQSPRKFKPANGL